MPQWLSDDQVRRQQQGSASLNSFNTWVLMQLWIDGSNISAAFGHFSCQERYFLWVKIG